MKTVSFCGYQWITQERCCRMHRNKPYVWYSPDSVKQKSDNEIALLNQYQPTYIEEYDKYPEIGVGLISCTEKLGYGKYELEVKLPEAPYSWAAFWMWSYTSDWLPEIDVLEAYSDDSSKYNIKRPWYMWWKQPKFDIRSNVHYKCEDKHAHTGDLAHSIGALGNPLHYNKYSVIWLEDIIEFYYNNKLVRTISDPKVLSAMRGHKMNVVINNTYRFSHPWHKSNKSEMLIRNFSYSKI